VPGQDIASLSGKNIPKVFEVPYQQIPKLQQEMEAFVTDHVRSVEIIYFFYTTCPRCAKQYGENDVVVVVKVQSVAN
jgi:hypothetical protein